MGRTASKTKKAAPKRTPRKKAIPPVKQPDLSWHDAFIASFEVNANVRAACEAAGIARSVAYEHYEAYPEFRARWDSAKENAIDRLEEVARTRAVNSSDTLLIFLMKAHRPDIYRETVRAEHTGRNGRPIETVSITVDQWKDQAAKRRAETRAGLAPFEGDDA